MELKKLVPWNWFKKEKDKDYYCVERSFQRVLSLPQDADHDHIRAGFKRGVLTIHIPRKALPGSTARRIEIQQG